MFWFIETKKKKIITFLLISILVIFVIALLYYFQLTKLPSINVNNAKMIFLTSEVKPSSNLLSDPSENTKNCIVILYTNNSREEKCFPNGLYLYNSIIKFGDELIADSYGEIRYLVISDQGKLSIQKPYRVGTSSDLNLGNYNTISNSSWIVSVINNGIYGDNNSKYTISYRQIGKTTFESYVVNTSSIKLLGIVGDDLIYYESYFSNPESKENPNKISIIKYNLNQKKEIVRKIYVNEDYDKISFIYDPNPFVNNYVWAASNSGEDRLLKFENDNFEITEEKLINTEIAKPDSRYLGKSDNHIFFAVNSGTLNQYKILGLNSKDLTISKEIILKPDSLEDKRVQYPIQFRDGYFFLINNENIEQDEHETFVYKFDENGKQLEKIFVGKKPNYYWQQYTWYIF